MNAIVPDPAASIDWDRIRPLLDDLVAELGERDREAVMLRFFEGRTHAEIGAQLRLSEDGARSRVERALEKLHTSLQRRGVTSTTAALGLALGQQVAIAAPAGLAASVTGAALAGTASAGAAVGIFMSMTTLQVAALAVITAGATTGLVLQANTNADLRREFASAQAEHQAVAALRTENQQLAAAAVEVQRLQQDDTEYQRLAQAVAAAQQASQEKARVSRARATADRRAQLEAILREKDAEGVAKIDELQRQGNKLVEEYKALQDRARDPALTPEARAQADQAVQAKLEAIQLKQRAIKEVMVSTREALTPEADELRALGGSVRTELPAAPNQNGGRLELRRVDATGQPQPR